MWTSQRDEDLAVALRQVRNRTQNIVSLIGTAYTLPAAYTPIHAAIMSGNTKVVVMLIEAGANVNVRDQMGKTPISYTVSKGYSDMWQVLISHGADLHNIDDAGHGLLHQIAISDKLEPHLEPELSGEEQDQQEVLVSDIFRFPGMPTRATRADIEDLLSSLLEKGCAINAQTANGASLLHLAAGKRDLNMIRLLLKHGADCRSANDQGETPIFWALCGSPVYINLETIRMISTAELDFDDSEAAMVTWTDGLPTENIPAPRNSTMVTPTQKELSLACVRLLIRAGADSGHLTVDKNLALHYAIAIRVFVDPSIIKAMIVRSRDFNTANKDGITPLHLAAFYGYPTITSLLLKMGARPNISPSLTMLIAAVMHGAPVGRRSRC
jgi:ankyrin repeat protein